MFQQTLAAIGDSLPMSVLLAAIPLARSLALLAGFTVLVVLQASVLSWMGP